MIRIDPAALAAVPRRALMALAIAALAIMPAARARADDLTGFVVATPPTYAPGSRQAATFNPDGTMRVSGTSGGAAAGSTPNGNITYASVSVGASSTLVLAAAPATRSLLDLWNISGRFSGAGVDIWCNWGVPAVLGQGFPVFAGGANVFRSLPNVLDPRALNCIGSGVGTLNVGSLQS